MEEGWLKLFSHMVKTSLVLTHGYKSFPAALMNRGFRNDLCYSILAFFSECIRFLCNYWLKQTLYSTIEMIKTYHSNKFFNNIIFVCRYPANKGFLVTSCGKVLCVYFLCRRTKSKLFLPTGLFEKFTNKRGVSCQLLFKRHSVGVCCQQSLFLTAMTQFQLK